MAPYLLTDCQLRASKRWLNLRWYSHGVNQAKRRQALAQVTEVNGEVNGKWHVQADSTFEHYLNPNVHMDTQLALEQLQDETRHLRELLDRRDSQIESMNQHIERLSQLLAVSHRSLQQVADQVQLLIEDDRKPSFWKRLFGR